MIPGCMFFPLQRLGNGNQVSCPGATQRLKPSIPSQCYNIRHRIPVWKDYTRIHRAGAPAYLVISGNMFRASAWGMLEGRKGQVNLCNNLAICSWVLNLKQGGPTIFTI